MSEENGRRKSVVRRNLFTFWSSRSS